MNIAFLSNNIYAQKLTALLLAFVLFLAPMSQMAYAQTTPLITSETTITSETKTEITATTDTTTSTRIVDETIPVTDPAIESTNPKEITDAEPLGGEEEPIIPLENKSTREKIKMAETDLSSGALTYSYGIDVPPGRNGLNPNIGISYNSQNSTQDSIVGYGWSLNIPYIERLNKNGSDQLYINY